MQEAPCVVGARAGGVVGQLGKTRLGWHPAAAALDAECARSYAPRAPGDAPVTCLGGRLRRDGGPQQSRRPSAFRGAHSREISGPDSPESRSRSGDDDGAGSAERSHYRGRPGLPSPMVAATTKGPPEWAGSVPSQSGNSGPLAH
ncbi:hypothetical protein IscW_ISCW006200 [Ixodes scapularis]|uniref:Uncharacterized protein n=1 Tax=Ixodes scapularis TaxID=6945 RepID=B7PKL4_IXOSC|nr:hypothetical protein IscW_ISCW006200 [Ixodes scapularis]|eukprot:XP_002400713.1 hypothetical protein IscW_ISCW006200 [Ixodes scapularis]